MHEMRYEDWSKRDEVEELLHEKRNLMVYDGRRDGLDEKVDYRFFYSSPGDALEFVIGDIFRNGDDFKIDGRSIKRFGEINIIREPGDFCEEIVECLFGIVVVGKIKVREIDRINITLNLNSFGVKRLKDSIEYFEKSFCVKDTD